MTAKYYSETLDSSGEYRFPEWERTYIRACERFLSSRGYEPDSNGRYEVIVNSHSLSDKERFEIWAIESVHYALVSRDVVDSFRGYVQALEYRGRLGGTLPGGSTFNDAMSYLRSRFEARLSASR